MSAHIANTILNLLFIFVLHIESYLGRDFFQFLRETRLCVERLMLRLSEHKPLLLLQLILLGLVAALGAPLLATLLALLTLSRQLRLLFRRQDGEHL